MQEIVLNTPGATCSIRVGFGLSSGIRKLEPTPILLVDEHVYCQHSELFEPHECIIVPAGEKYKTIQTVESLYRELVKVEAERNSMLLGVGGGLATDVAGFVAATYLREVRFGFISTTLLGQVDASIGGKNGVNLDGYKNMVGTIRQPEYVWCDLSLLSTLARKEYISGIAEVIKYGAIMDPEFLDYLEGNMAGLLDMDKEVLEHVVSHSARCKVEIVEKDEKEAGLRRLLNFGHTVGHAMERELKVLHGYAVSAGMVLAARMSQKLGMIDAAFSDRLEGIIASAGLPTAYNVDAGQILANIRKDKKKDGDSINFVLLEGPGKAMVRPIPLEDLKSILNDLC